MRSRRGAAANAAAAVAAIAIATPATGQAGPPGGRDAAAAKSIRDYPWEKRVHAAARYARRRGGAVSFAIVDERGRIYGYRRGSRYSSASLVKAMLLVAYLRKGDVRNRGLHDAETAELGPMIRVSDNAAADAIHARVGSAGLIRLARRADMNRFIPNEAWGGSQVTAHDQARFFAAISRLLPDRHRSYALGLLASVTGGQRWGIPRGRPSGWRAHFKGGWYPSDGGWRVHQGALLRRHGRKLGLAVLTEGGLGLGYGAKTIREVTERLLRGYNRFRAGGGKRRDRFGARR